MKNFFRLPLTLLAFVFLMSSCDENLGLNSGLSDEEIAEGLKQALIIGTDTSTSQLSASGGYYQDLAVKILLPDAIRNHIDNFKSKSINLGITTITGADLYNGYSNSLLGININGLKTKEDALVKGINNAAESAAGTAAPIFVDAITDITIADASEILFGGDDRAATLYLEGKTSVLLFNEYEPMIDNALQSVKVGNNSIVEEYEDFVNEYNAILNTSIPGFGTIGTIANVQTVTVTDLSVYATDKGLDGLFLKIGEEEEDIRKDPLARVNAILQKIFGELD